MPMNPYTNATPPPRTRQQVWDDIVRFWDAFPVIRVYEPQGHDPYNYVGRFLYPMGHVSKYRK